MVVHPRTSLLVDPALPAVATLLSAQPPIPLRAAVATAGGEIDAIQLKTVTWWPGTSITATYRATITGGELGGEHDFVATSGRIPEGALIVDDEGTQIGVWRVPHDPALPGLVPALDPVATGDLLDNLGVEGGDVSANLRAYRPGRRAVVSVGGRRAGIYLKLLRPKRVEDLHRRHQHLASHLPVPHSLGFSRDQGIVALQAKAGHTLRRSLEDSDARLPAPEAIATLIEELPRPTTERVSQSPVERLPKIGQLLAHIVPDEAGRIGELVDEIGEETIPATTPSHGDFYEAQVMVEDGRVVGILDVDTYGWGRPGDDPATMIGHLDLWRHLSRYPERVGQYAAALLSRWDGVHDPAELRRRVAAVHLTLAPGSFRVQTADWPSETVARIALAERWLESARLADEKGLTSVSGPS